VVSNALELWGGIECTVNRVGERYFNQLARSGHAHRADDIDRIAALGIKALRYPILWELTAPGGSQRIDWSWAAKRLQRIRDGGITPIVGLVHHGSGPSHTGLIQDSFVDGLAEYATQVATRFPWLEWYTPVNEPLTTARFSGLYGLWYPHGRDSRTFARALLNETRATVLAMESIRRINRQAKLLQTEDLGRTFSTPKLRYQCDFENERRWLTWDLLCGRVDKYHPMRSYLLEAGIDARELDWFDEHRCPPDVVGINHYVTSDRFLDERLDRYPPQCWGGNGQVRYADVDAVRVLSAPSGGWRSLLQEAWERYHLPLALTEVHLGCTRDEQLRWLHEAWLAALCARDGGCDVRAVTAWALFGSFDWNTLLTMENGHYEVGAFDVRACEPRATALAQVLRCLSAGGEVRHPALASPGWWRRPERLLFSPVPGPASAPKHAVRTRQKVCRPLLITGAGTLGKAFARVCAQRALANRVCTRAELDICDAGAIARVLEDLKPWAIINTAGYVRVDDAEREPDRCYHANTDGPRVLAIASAERGIPLLTFSSDLVFDGADREAYIESKPTSPLNIYGRSKAEAELCVLQHHPDALVIRTSAFFSPWDPHNFISLALHALSKGEAFDAMSDVIVSPTYIPDLVEACLDLLIDGECGVWHLANEGAISWARFARQAAELTHVDATTLRERTCRELRLAAARPPFSVLATERGVRLPSLDDALGRYAVHGAHTWA
jgi:dTDP-4-dehydrorhamnose reductase